MSMWFGPDAAPALEDFWSIYAPNAARIAQLTRSVAERHPEFGPIVRAQTAPAEDNTKSSMSLLRRAIDGDWESYESHLREQGRGYAKLGISYAGWFDLMQGFQRELTELSIEKFRDEPKRLADVLVTVQTFINKVMSVLGQEFVDTKERLLAEQRRLAEDRAAEISASEARYRVLFENSPIPMWVFDRETLRFLSVNDAAVKHYGFSREEFARMTLRDIRDRSELPALDQSLASLPTLSVGKAWKHKKKDGKEIQVEVASHAIHWEGRPAQLAAIHDVTERRALEEQFRQSQKMDAIGHLAGGVAHDFNNLLTAMLSFTKFAHDDLPEGHPSRADLTEVLNAGQRAATLTRQLLTFSRRQVVDPQILDVNLIVSDAEKMLKRLIGSGIELDTAFEKKLPPVLMDRGHLDQVVLNLVVNARDAMGEHGKLTIETSLVELDDTYVRGHVGAKPGRYVMLAVTDTGCGMDEAVQARIFEPFFTTKPEGKGTGLGLSTVFGIVKQAGGDLRVYSSPGHGSTFKIYLPVAANDAAATAIEARPAAPKGREQILLVEDDDAVRAVARRTLKSGGYTLLEATSPAHALELCAQQENPIHLMLTDIVMPKMNGRELAEQAAKIRPGLKIVFMSGYTGGAMVHQGVVESGAAYLQKPFTPESLLTKVRAALDAPSNSTH